jgi:hypothetical protein
MGRREVDLFPGRDSTLVHTVYASQTFLPGTGHFEAPKDFPYSSSNCLVVTFIMREWYWTVQTMRLWVQIPLWAYRHFGYFCFVSVSIKELGYGHRMRWVAGRTASIL